jgi:molecular chaperone GrpE
MSEHTALPEEHLPSPAEAEETLLPDIGEVAIEVEPMAAELGLQLPGDPEAARDLLLVELTEARQESSRLLEDLQRVAADYANYRKRTERDQIENVLRASQRVAESLLPALDGMDAALAYQAQTDGERMMLDGIRSTHSLLLDSLAREGLEPLPAQPGAPFDPAIHEAVAGPAAGDGDLVVAQEVRRGYGMRGRVIRPALVVVRTDADDA